MSVRRLRRQAQRGQALILALALLGLLSAFSVSALRLESAAQTTAGSVRESAYRDAAGQAAGQMARQLIADGLGCNTSTPTTAQYSAETVSVTVAQSSTPLSPPAACATTEVDSDGDGGTVPGTYVLCATVTTSGGSYAETISVSAQPGGPGNPLTVDIVHFDYGQHPPC
jgi:hypothetical protein